MNISGPFIRRPIGTSLLAMGVFVLGMICYSLLGVAALPNMQFPVIFVQASQAGADASTMASTVAAPLERHLGQVPGIDTMRSRSSEGSTSVFLMLQSGVDIDAAARDVQAAINASAPDLPPGLNSSPSYQKANPNDDPIIAFALTSETQDAADLYNVADSLLAQRLRQLDGISSVDIAGAATPAIRVDLNLRALNSMGLSPDQLRNALVAANVTSPVGFLSDGKTTMAITANDQLKTAQDFANLVVAMRNGTPVRLSDVGRVYAGTQDAYQAAWFQGKPAILMYVYKKAGANVIATVDSVRDLIPTLRSYLQPGTVLTPYFDGTPTIRASLHEVQATLLISLAMVVLTMALFLRRLAPTLIAAVAVPLSLAGGFIVMHLLGYTLNNLTLLALVIAIGFVVDDAIVVIENIIRHIDQGMSRFEATLAGAKEIGFTIVSITASLIAVFIPLLFAGGITGLFMHEFTMTLVAAIAMSALVSLTLTPSLCGRFLSGHAHHAKPSRFGDMLERFHERMLGVYTRALNFSLKHALAFALTPLALIFLTIVLFGVVKQGFFPPQDTGLIWARSTSSATVSFGETIKRQERITNMLLSDPAVKSVSSRLGTSRQGTAGSFSIELKTRAEGRKENTFDVLARLSAKANQYPDLNVRLRPLQDLPSGGGGQGQGAQYQISLQGNNSDELQTWLPKLVAELKKNPKLKDVGSDIDDAGLRQNIVIDRDKAARLGVSIGTIDGALYNAFGQRQVSTIYSDINQYKVVLNALPAQTATPDAINRIYVASNKGEMVPLTALARQEPGVAPSQIAHENQYTTMDLSFNLAPNVSMGEAMMIVQSTAKNMRMPGDIRLNVGGDFRRFQQSQSGMLWLLAAAVITVYIVLGMLYESLIHPVTILSTLPAAGVGALVALWVTNTDLSMIAQIALVLLIGIVKKNAIMMIDFALVAQREHGKPPLEAAREACIVRFRPIMMTTMVAILAAMPIAIGLGEGSELRRPLGIALIGGLIISQSLTLLSTPALYVIFSCLSDHWKAWRARRRARRVSGLAPANVE
ncbi:MULTISPECIES: efflux RND transporter permease subunit [Dyella]|uniref:Efflux RND transporter permease subunit n=2 Tax=Dyella TaxID=231454 RepID=A0A4R0YCZ1_9GAMM|nr:MULTISPECIES: efflux RND transporter permease subunit [Dyella]TBR36209.1 efflux RND transporter permease subunit [Dyella terrae]TCI05866.1 efflux RND transporter permease subunit [Dyella soli]